MSNEEVLRFGPLAYDKEHHLITSAVFGEVVVVEIQWNTDSDNRPINFEEEEAPRSLYGPFKDLEEAQVWMDVYPEFKEIHEMEAFTMNLVRPMI